MAALSGPEIQEVQAVIAPNELVQPVIVRTAVSGEPSATTPAVASRPLSKERSAFPATVAPGASEAHAIARPQIPVGPPAGVALHPLRALGRADYKD